MSKKNNQDDALDKKIKSALDKMTVDDRLRDKVFTACEAQEKNAGAMNNDTNTNTDKSIDTNTEIRPRHLYNRAALLAAAFILAIALPMTLFVMSNINPYGNGNDMYDGNSAASDGISSAEYSKDKANNFEDTKGYEDSAYQNVPEPVPYAPYNSETINGCTVNTYTSDDGNKYITVNVGSGNFPPEGENSFDTDGGSRDAEESGDELKQPPEATGDEPVADNNESNSELERRRAFIKSIIGEEYAGIKTDDADITVDGEIIFTLRP